MVPLVLLLVITVRLVLVNNDRTLTPLVIGSLRCDELEPLWLEAQSVPSATLVPCVRSTPAGWTFGGANVRNGWAKFTLNDAVSSDRLVVRLSAGCDTSGAIQRPSDQAGARHYERRNTSGSGPATIWYAVFPGGCVTAELHATDDADNALADQVSNSVGLTTRQALQQALDERSKEQLRLDADTAG